MNKKNMKRIIYLIVVLVVLGAAWSAWSYFKSDAASDTAGKSAEVKLGSIQSIVTAQGTLQPRYYVDVGAQISGTVEVMHVDIGDHVKTGDLIAEIDPDIYEAQVRATEARLNQLQAQKTEQEALIKQAEWKYERYRNLYNDQAVSKEVMQDTEISLEVAKAKLLSLEAQIQETQSQLDGEKANLNYTKIYAPMDGTIVNQLVQEGQTINANQTTPTIVQVANLDIMTAKAEVAEADVMKLHVDVPMYFTTLGSGGRRWEGKVRQILPTPEEINDVVLYSVLVDVGNEDHVLLPGMTTQTFFVLATAENVPIIPISALGNRVPEEDNERGQAYQVQVMTHSGPVTKTVIIGLSDRTQAEVVDGLSVGDRVVENVKAPLQGEGQGRPVRMRL